MPGKLITDIDGVALTNRIPYGQQSGTDFASMLESRTLLERLHANHQFEAIAVTNMPGPQLCAWYKALFGKSAAEIHYAESGAVLVKGCSRIHPDYYAWVYGPREEITDFLIQNGFETFEDGVLVNIIVVNPAIHLGEPALAFEEKLVSLVNSMEKPLRDQVELSIGLNGNIADIRPCNAVQCGWSKQFGFDQIVASSEDINWEQTAASGDTASDIPLITSVAEKGGFVFVPANASDALKEVVYSCKGYLSKHPYEQGFLEGLQQLEQRRFSKNSSQSRGDRVYA